MRLPFSPLKSCARYSIGFLLIIASSLSAQDSMQGTEFFERRIRPLLIKHCYECHSEEHQERMGGLLLDRSSGWLKGGDTDKAVIPGEPEASLLMKAIQYHDDSLQMPPEGKLSDSEIQLFQSWIKRGAPGPAAEPNETSFSQLGQQDLLFEQAEDHWAFQPLSSSEPPAVDHPLYQRTAIDRFIYRAMNERGLTPTRPADPRTLLRRLSYDLTGLPPTFAEIEQFIKELREHRPTAIESTVERLLASPAFGEKIGRMWLDVARYADTDSRYRPDTKTPHYFPFAFSYRDYVIRSLNADKPFDLFIQEQLAADLMGYDKDAPEQAALGFLAVGPHAGGSNQEEIDDWIDVTTRGVMGLTAACARCHDHKFEPIPTEDYYALYGVFASVDRMNPLNEKGQPELATYQPEDRSQEDYLKQRAEIEEKINEAGSKTAKNNNRSIAQKIRETELAALLTYHPGAPAHAMVVREKKAPVTPFVFIRGEPSNRGEQVSRRFLKVLDPEESPFSKGNSGRLELAHALTSPDNPLTARVFVNRVWGMLMGKYLVESPSNFGVTISPPTHPELLDWLTRDFIEHDWSVKHLVRTIVMTSAYQQSSFVEPEQIEKDTQNLFYSRANRRHLSVEELRDSIAAVAGTLDRTLYGHPVHLWEGGSSVRRTIYGFINRFNLDPTLRAFDFPTPMQTQPGREESVVATQALFSMNSEFVSDQVVQMTEREEFKNEETSEGKTRLLFQFILQRNPTPPEIAKVHRFLELQDRFDERDQRLDWPLVAQSLLMSNEFQYLD